MPLTRRALVKSALALISAYSIAGAGMAWGRKVTVIDLGLGRRLVFIPDAHIHSVDRELADEVNRLNPDLVLLGGDTYDRWSNLDDVVETLKLIHAPKIGVLGNHEHWADRRYGRIPLEEGLSALEESGVTLLFDESIEVGGVRVAGVDWRDDPRDYSRASVGDADILMVHSPDAFPHVGGGYRMVLAGHTHGGQICLPGPKPVVTNSVYGYYAGYYRRDDGLVMYVSRGAGHMIPVRLYCSREIVLIK